MVGPLTARVRSEISAYAVRPPAKFGVLHAIHPRLGQTLCGAGKRDWAVLHSPTVPDHKICRACRRIRDGRRPR